MIAYLVALGLGAILIIATMARSGLGAARRLGGGFAAWMPVASPHFWAYFLVVAGAIGAILTRQGVAAAPIVLAVAVVIGWLTGVVAVAIVRAMRGTTIDPSAGDALIGARGTVTAAIPERGHGTVRLEAHGRSFERAAEGEYSAAVPAGSTITVVGVAGGDRVLVSSSSGGGGAT